MTQILDDPAARTPRHDVPVPPRGAAARRRTDHHRHRRRLEGAGRRGLHRPDQGLGKTIRKRNGIVGFGTQSAQDALSSKISSAIIEQAATQIFMVNPQGAGGRVLRRLRPDLA
jgi:type IV secretion system protein VirB4